MRTAAVMMIVTCTVFAQEWTIKRNPFTVSDAYIKQTKKTYLTPKNNYIPFDIKLLGIAHTAEGKEGIFEIEFEGIRRIGLNQSIRVNTPDIESRLKVIKIGEHCAAVSLNGGEGIRYEVK